METARVIFDCKTHDTLAVTARSGLTYCFNCTVEEHQTKAFNLAVRFMGDLALAEDATQEAFVSACRAFSSFRGENLKGWLFRIVANSCRDMLRGRRSRPSVPLDEMILNPSSEPVSREESPEDYAQRRELGSLIKRGMDTLPQDQRLAMTLIDIQGMSYEEASQTMGCSLGTVKSRLSRARSAMRDFLQDHRELIPREFRQDE